MLFRFESELPEANTEFENRNKHTNQINNSQEVLIARFLSLFYVRCIEIDGNSSDMNPNTTVNALLLMTIFFFVFKPFFFRRDYILFKKAISSVFFRLKIRDKFCEHFTFKRPRRIDLV